MELITIDAIPSQSFTVTLGGNNYELKIYSIDGHMSYDLSINSAQVIAGYKMVNDIPLLAYPHQELSGNILLQIAEDEIPDYKKFGLSQFLYYLTEEEKTAYRLAADL
tara:strand:- start:186 stop:509 length:324 start_codon:yes stop_codon:yes gene_type:complete